MQKRYEALRTIARILRVVAYIIAALGVLSILGGVLMLVLGGPKGAAQGVMVSVFGAVYGFLGAIMMLAYAEAIHVFLDIEEHARSVCAILDQRLPAAAAPAEG
ncbi:MAG: hypothetical protein HYU66_17600 [Armatimonadetes bacterium]|nr:hypothetical protein [Armatimonadota bacterium]